MSAVLVCLTMLFACIPKASAYSSYISDLDLEQVLYCNNHKISTEINLENGYTNSISNLTFYYGYELEEDETYLYIFMYEFEVYDGTNPRLIKESCQWYIPLNQEVFDEIGTEGNDAQIIDQQFELLTRSTIKMSLYLQVEGNTITPIVNFVDYDYITDNEFEMQSFDRVQPMFQYVLLNDNAISRLKMLECCYLSNEERNHYRKIKLEDNKKSSEQEKITASTVYHAVVDKLNELKNIITNLTKGVFLWQKIIKLE